MRYDKHLTRLERKSQKQAKLANDMAGHGLYLFENNSSGDLQLPRATHTGRRSVRKGEQFEGDSYYFQLVKSHDLKFIKELESPTPSGETMKESKLITEQPPLVTSQGTVEFVQPDHSKQKLNEDQPNKKEQKQNVLLTEDPLAGVVIVD